MLRILITFIIITTPLTATIAQAENTAITQSMVSKIYSEMEEALNNRKAYTDLISTLHRQMKNDAEIKVTINNPALKETAGQTAVALSKEDYINNFVHGTAHIMNYHVDIQTTDFEYNPSTLTATSTEKMTETGQMLDPRTYDPKTAKNFVSTTRCKTTFSKDSGDVVVTDKVCKTQVSFAEDI